MNKKIAIGVIGILSVVGVFTVVHAANPATSVPQVGGDIHVVHTNGSGYWLNATTTSDVGRGTALLTAVSAASTGDHFYLASSTFNIGNTYLDAVAKQLSFHGAGPYATTIKSSYTSPNNGIIKPGSNTIVEDLGITCINTPSVVSIPYGATNASLSNAILRNAYFNCGSDGVLLRVVRGATTTLIVDGLTTDTQFDSFNLSQENEAGNAVVPCHVEIRDSNLRQKPGSAFSGQMRGIVNAGCDVYVDNTNITSTGGSSENIGYNLSRDPNATTTVSGGTVTVTGTSAYAFQDNGSGIKHFFVSPDVIYDPMKVTGGHIFGTAPFVQSSVGITPRSSFDIKSSIDTPTNVSAGVAYDTGNFTADCYSFQYRVYAYKMIDGVMTFSSSYGESNSTSDDCSSNPDHVLVSWTPVSGADGYRILGSNGYACDINGWVCSFDWYIDTQDNILDDNNVNTWTIGSTVTPLGGADLHIDDTTGALLVNRYVGIGTTTVPAQLLTVDGKAYIVDSLGIGIADSSAIYSAVRPGVPAPLDVEETNSGPANLMILANNSTNSGAQVRFGFYLGNDTGTGYNRGFGFFLTNGSGDRDVSSQGAGFQDNEGRPFDIYTGYATAAPSNKQERIQAQFRADGRISFGGATSDSTGGGSGTFDNPALFTVQTLQNATTTVAIRAKSGQTASLLNFLDSSSNTIGTFTTAGLLGVGTSSPFARLSVQSGDTSTDLLALATTTARTLYRVDANGHVHYGGVKPTVSCAATCSLDPNSSDSRGVINLSGVQTSVTLTFSKAYGSPVCVTSDTSTTGTYKQTATTTTTLVLGVGVSLGTDTINYHCDDIK